MTLKEAYFSLKNNKSKFLTEGVIKAILIDAGGFNDFGELVKGFSNDVLDEVKFNNVVKEVEKGVPVQYAIGKAPFLGLTLKVDRNVLIPRTETEELVVTVTEFCKRYQQGHVNIADIGTGSGCIAIYLAKNVPNSTVFATDISMKAIEVAADNASSYEQVITFYQGNLVEPLIKTNTKIDILVSNPPYIRDESTIQDIVLNNEPREALIAEPVTKHYDFIFENAYKVMSKNGVMFFEIGEDMEDELTASINKYLPGSKFVFSKDLYGKTRFLFVKLGDLDA